MRQQQAAKAAALRGLLPKLYLSPTTGRDPTPRLPLRLLDFAPHPSLHLCCRLPSNPSPFTPALTPSYTPPNHLPERHHTPASLPSITYPRAPAKEGTRASYSTDTTTTMPSVSSSQQKAAVSEFIGITQSDKSTASKVLKQHGYNVQAAINA